MKGRYFLLLTLLAVSVGAAANEVTWFDGQHPVRYQVVGKADPVVSMALQMFCSDMRQVTGMTPLRASGSSPSAVTIPSLKK